MFAWASPLEVATSQAQELLQRRAPQPADQAHSSRRDPLMLQSSKSPLICWVAGRDRPAPLESAVNDAAT